MLNPHPPLVFPFAHPHELKTCNPPCLTFFPPARTQNLYPPLPTLSALVFIKPWSKAWRQDLSKKIHYKSKGQRGGATDGGTGSTEGSSCVHVALQSSKSKRRSSRGPKWGRVAAAFTLSLSLRFHCARACASRRRPSWPATCAASEDNTDGNVRQQCM